MKRTAETGAEFLRLLGHFVCVGAWLLRETALAVLLLLIVGVAALSPKL